jgi:hypothetical protein
MAYSIVPEKIEKNNITILVGCCFFLFFSDKYIILYRYLSVLLYKPANIIGAQMLPGPGLWLSPPFLWWQLQLISQSMLTDLLFLLV